MRFVVVGGGIAGLASAARLRELAGDGAEIVVVEAGDRLGGKIRTQTLGGLPAEAGAETFLLSERGAESAALTMVRGLGLADELVYPAPVAPMVAVGGGLRPIPPATLMGIPIDPAGVTGVATVVNRDDDTGRPLIAEGDDVAVGALVRSRYGDEVVDRLVDPLLGGIYAGSADGLSLRVTVPGLHAAASREHTLAAAARAAVASAPRPAGTPMFGTFPGGLYRLVSALSAKARTHVRLGERVHALSRTTSGWRLDLIGPGGRATSLEADGLVLAVPADVAAGLVSPVSATAATAIGALDYATVGLVSLLLPAGTPMPSISGFLVPAVEGLAVKAATIFTTKWPHLRPGSASPADAPVLIRASFGRYGESAVVDRDDADLIDLARVEVGGLLGVALPVPVEAMVHRWIRALPQYGVGHIDRVERARAALPATVALAGAGVDGVGISACVRSGLGAAESVWTALSATPGDGGLGQSTT